MTELDKEAQDWLQAVPSRDVDISVPLVRIRNVNAWYGSIQALHNVTFDIPEHAITAFIGPSGCGKTTLLRSINRLNDLVSSYHLEGELLLRGENLYARKGGSWVNGLRRGIGMVFQASNPLPVSVLENLVLPLREHFRISRAAAEKKAIEKLKLANLYEEVEDKLHQSALRLSGGQQQRLCIARALMLDSDILLLDEPCSALDPISTYKIEDLLSELKSRFTIIMVTHNMEQASRIADKTVYFYRGEVLESGPTSEIFLNPKHPRLQRYLKGAV